VADLRIARRLVDDARAGLSSGRHEASALIAALRERAAREADTKSAEANTHDLETSRAA
jgi:hypothetical protein